ncbi:MAG: hypothetical protein LBV79_04900 [Candidatus Adiutrix sp.]|jgi:hypothetical protein|nr:hypothetical protein [Candidatus Adiutrix sp.]
MKRGKLWRNLTFLSLGLALMGYLTAPNFLGLAVFPLAAAPVFAALTGRARWQADWAALRSPAGRSRLTVLGAGLASVLFLLAAASGSFWPRLDFSQGRVQARPPATLALLARLEQPVSVTVHIGPQDSRSPRIRELMAQYVQAAGGRLTVTYVNPQTDAAQGELGPRLVTPDTAEIIA